MKDTVQTVMWVAIDTDKAITLQQCRQGGGSVAITSVGAVVLDGGITAHGNVSISSGGGALSLTPMKAGLMQPPAVLPSPRPMAPSGRLTAASRCLPPVSGKDVYIEVKSGNVLLDATAAGTLDIRASHVMNGKVSAPTLVLASDKGIGSAGDYLSLSYAGGSLVTASITGADGSI